MKRTLALLFSALAASSASAWQSQTWTPTQGPRYQVQPLAPKLYTPAPWTATTIDTGSGFSTTTIRSPNVLAPSINCQTMNLGGFATTTCR